MGYDVHIIRSARRTDREISLDDWLGYIDSDPDMQRPPHGVADHSGRLGLLRSLSSDPNKWPCLSWTSGSIHTKSPNRRTLLKMVAISNHFGAQVVGDEGEIYTSDADGRLFADGREWQAVAPENTSCVDHESRWAALWVFELYPVTIRLDEGPLMSLLIQHFQILPDAATDLINCLQNSCGVVLGTQSESTYLEFPRSVAKMGLICKATALDPSSPERYPLWLAPADHFQPQPWNLTISGYQGASDLDSCQQLLSEHLGISRDDGKVLMEKVRQGTPMAFKFDDLEEACNAADPLKSHGFAIDVR